MFVTVISAPRSEDTRYIQTASGIKATTIAKSLNKWIESTKQAIRVMGSTHAVHTIDIGSGLMLDVFIMQLSSKGPVDQLAQSLVINRIAQQARAAGQKVNQFLINLGLTGIAVSDVQPSEHDFAFMVTPLHGDYPEDLKGVTVLSKALEVQPASVAVLDVPLYQLGVVDSYAVVPMDINMSEYPSLQEDNMYNELDEDLLGNQELAADDLDLESEDFSEDDHSQQDLSEADESEEDRDDSDQEDDQERDDSDQERDDSDQEHDDQEDDDQDDQEHDDQDDDDLLMALDDIDNDDIALQEADEDSLVLVPVEVKPRLIFVLDSNPAFDPHMDQLSDIMGFNFVSPIASASKDPKSQEILKPAGYLREPISHLLTELSQLTKSVMVLNSQYDRSKDLLVGAACNTAQQALDHALYQMNGLVEDDQEPSDVSFTLGNFEDGFEAKLSDLVDGGVSVNDGYLNVYVRTYFPRFFSSKAQQILDLVRKILKRMAPEGVEVVVGFTGHLSNVLSGGSVVQGMETRYQSGEDKSLVLGQAFTVYGMGSVFGTSDSVKVDSAEFDFDEHESIFTEDPTGAPVDLGLFGDADLLVLVSDCFDPETEE